MQPHFAERYADLERWHWWFRGRRAILADFLQRQLAPAKSRKLLSLGCGPAEGLQWLTAFAGPEGVVVGVDVDPQHACGLPKQCEFVVSSFESAPLRSHSFDLVLALDVLEHLDNDTAGVREAARLLKPGGLLCVTVPAFPSLWGGQDIVSHHRRRYTKSTLMQLFAHAGLPSPAVTYFNSLLAPPIAALRWTRALLGRASRPESDFDRARPGLPNDVLAAIFSAERHMVGRVAVPFGISLLARATIRD